ncbi:hypothetical protein CRG98_030077 [Punica granatum]|uniref:Uncharacterized protein n=1 Tax=Punica granatum TaxID=22663 RepID=A0A2I0J0T8_PUNGR|nr:hypothetical protein CRG98_030077 [Punica granatum]
MLLLGSAGTCYGGAWECPPSQGCVTDTRENESPRTILRPEGRGPQRELKESGVEFNQIDGLQKSRLTLETAVGPIELPVKRVKCSCKIEIIRRKLSKVGSRCRSIAWVHRGHADPERVEKTIVPPGSGLRNVYTPRPEQPQIGPDSS